MLSSFLYLLFAHLVSDFVLQPWELVMWKHRSWKGVAIHAFIHLLMMLAVFAPFGVSGDVFMVAVLVALSHFCVDTLKVLFERWGRKFYKYFILDQTAHVMFLLVGSAVLGGPPLGGIVPFGGELDRVLEGAIPGTFGLLTSNSLWNLYFNQTLIIGLCSAIIFSWAIEVAMYQFQRERDPAAPFRPHRAAVITRLIIVLVLTGFAAGI